MSVLVIMLVPWAYAAKQQVSLACLLGATALLVLVLAFGESLSVFTLLYWLLPPFRVVRIPPRALVLWVPCTTLLGGMGLQVLSRRLADSRWLSWGRRAYATLSVSAMGAGAGCWAGSQVALPALPPTEVPRRLYSPLWPCRCIRAGRRSYSLLGAREVQGALAATAISGGLCFFVEFLPAHPTQRVRFVSTWRGS